MRACCVCEVREAAPGRARCRPCRLSPVVTTDPADTPYATEAERERALDHLGLGAVNGVDIFDPAGFVE